MQNKFLYRLEGVFNLPEKILPKINENNTCYHGNAYTRQMMTSYR